MMVKLSMSTDIIIETSWEGSTPLKSSSLHVMGGHPWSDANRIDLVHRAQMLLPGVVRATSSSESTSYGVYHFGPSFFGHLLEGCPSSCGVPIIDRPRSSSGVCGLSFWMFLPYAGNAS